MQPQRQDQKHVGCSCNGGGWLAEGGGRIPDCVCMVVGFLAGGIYWALPEGRRHVFAEIEPALCGTATKDTNEMVQRLMIVAEAAVRLNGGKVWDHDDVERMVDEVCEWREDRPRSYNRFISWTERAVELATKDPVTAWLALDTLSDLMVRAAK